MDPSRQALLDAVAVVPHTDADGLAAGAIALRLRGEGAAAAILLGRGRTPFAERGQASDCGGQASRPALPDGPLAILDWGIRPIDRGGILVDHHAPETPDPGPLVVTSYGEEPEVPTAPLMRRLVPEAPAWLAAIGGVGDVGDKAFALAECEGAAPKTAIKKLVSLVNAPRRLPDGPVRTALAILVEHDDPRAALADPRIGELEQAKAAWRAEFDRVVRTAPQMVGERLALLRFRSPAQVHPLVATTWSRRLAPRVVLAANDDYLAPGVVNFAVRGGSGDLRALLRTALPDATGEFAHGHDRATGGSLTSEDFERLLAAFAQPSTSLRTAPGT
jgi:single-stranded-DNA-specific exonuclease